MSDNTPVGYKKIEAYTNGFEIVVLEQKNWPLPTPPSGHEEDEHNCDVMGCGSVSEHVAARIKLTRTP